MDAGAQIVIEGLVQGVGFRYFIYRNATSLGLTGFTRNLYDGNVEIEVEGNRSAIEELIKLLKVGPRAAHVADLKIEWKDPQNRYTQFDIR